MSASTESCPSRPANANLTVERWVLIWGKRNNNGYSNRIHFQKFKATWKKWVSRCWLSPSHKPLTLLNCTKTKQAVCTGVAGGVCASPRVALTSWVGALFHLKTETELLGRDLGDKTLAGNRCKSLPHSRRGNHQTHKPGPIEKLRPFSILPVPCNCIFHATCERIQVTWVKVAK